jgi:hypothetical protein
MSGDLELKKILGDGVFLYGNVESITSETPRNLPPWLTNITHSIQTLFKRIGSHTDKTDAKPEEEV